MANHYGKNVSQARIASLSVNQEAGVNGLFKLATQIKRTGVGAVAINRSQRRFEERQQRKSK